MYFPSDKINMLIGTEEYGVWSEPYNGGKNVALLAKMPSTTIKAIHQGCKVELIVGVVEADNNHCVIAIKIYDSNKSPLLIPMATRTMNEVDGITSLINKLKFDFTIYNESNFPSIYGKGSLKYQKKPISKKYEHSLFKENNGLNEINKVINSFCYSIDPDYRTEKHYESSIDFFSVEFTRIDIIPVISHHEYGGIYHQIDEENEGRSQEEQLSHVLKIIHGENVCHSPQVKSKKKQRELIDVISYDSNCIFLFESKALCLNQSGYGIGNDRKVKKLIKSVEKAIKQLKGAMKKIQKDEIITTTLGSSLVLKNRNNIHGIVIISELLGSDEWSGIINNLNYNNNNGVCLNVIDLPELINIIKLSMSSTISFEQCLIEKHLAVIQYNTLNIKGIDSSLPINI